MVSAGKAIGSSVVTSTATRPDQGAIFRGHCSAPCSAPAKRDGHISRCGGPHALALYLLLVTVGDSQSLSYYSDKTAARLLGLSQAELRQARNHLLGAGLIAYLDPLYQCLSLEPTLDSEPPTARSGQALSISAILRRILESGDRPQS